MHPQVKKFVADREYLQGLTLDQARRLQSHGNPKIRKAGELLEAMAERHAHNEHNIVKDDWSANDVLSIVSADEIRRAL